MSNYDSVAGQLELAAEAFRCAARCIASSKGGSDASAYWLDQGHASMRQAEKALKHVEEFGVRL